MRRRTLIATVGAGIAGLAGCQTDGHDTPATPTRREGFTVAPEPASAPGLSWTVEKASAVTEAHPCRLRIALENTGPEREVRAAGRLPYPVTPGERADGEDGLSPVLLPGESDFAPRFSGTCWQAPVDDPDVADDAPWDWGHGEERTRTLAAGERVEASYFVAAEWTRYCFQPGEYRFARRYELDGERYEWAFALSVPTYDRDV